MLWVKDWSIREVDVVDVLSEADALMKLKWSRIKGYRTTTGVALDDHVQDSSTITCSFDDLEKNPAPMDFNYRTIEKKIPSSIVSF